MCQYENGFHVVFSLVDKIMTSFWVMIFNSNCGHVSFKSTKKIGYKKRNTNLDKTNYYYYYYNSKEKKKERKKKEKR
jgi:hypothetical protein